ncbi:hypothetical protein FSARC_3456 [Fusarium sarcochroum]|uniref:Xylanolytic transcriptional activator regulatory domain-containing protein n=1 Tax=Fusarium sarcochroum TaxID=1208366 RepID=A0A8H4XCM0_9HYPO|nr:hypothetical protein FSARC_3456 [Fusarium sarcochroum]
MIISNAGSSSTSTPRDELSNTGTLPLLRPARSAETSSTIPGQPSQELESLKSRVRQLEDQLSRSTTGSHSMGSTPSSIDASSQLGGTFRVYCQSRLFGGALPIPRAIAHKTRMFGQSHFINSFMLIMDSIEKLESHVDETSNIFIGLQKCKALARRIKTLRAPKWPTPLTNELPSKTVSDDLVECYLRTTEKIYRILHIPTFRKKYDALWTSDGDPDRDFLVQLKLVLALGATTYDDKFSMKTSATRWIYEAQTWISEPEFKSRLGIQFIQTNILLLLAREFSAVGGETTWIGCGSLLRTAVSMGLNRDPSQLSKGTALIAEMRRRLWNTILEISLQSSLASGAPPLISTEDFDTESPGNYDDDQLMTEDPIPRNEDVFTQMSTARALRKTFPYRLKVAKLLNDLNSPDSYKEILRVDSELRASYKTLSQTLHNCKPSHETSPSEFELSAVDFIMRRYLCALHFPFYGLSLHEASYAFSRKVTVETAFKIWCAACPPSADTNEFSRFIICTFGFFRTVAWQASLILVVELRSQLQEDDGLSPAPFQSNLFKIVEDAKSWTLRCIEAGETNMKGYCGVCLLSAEIQGISRRLPEDEVIKLMIQAGEEAEQEALVIFESFVAQLEPEGAEPQMFPNTGLDFVEDWDLIMTDGFFDTGDSDPMTWIF